MGHRVLILGMGGTLGSVAARAFRAAGWDVGRYHRGTDMAVAARGVQWIFNAMNPPNYHAWDKFLPEITAQVLAAAQASGARVMVPGNVYVFGTQPDPWGAATPHEPCSRKGRLRAEMEARYRAATDAGTKVLILRAGDFVQADAPATILNRVMLKSVGKGRVTAMGTPDVPRAYADLADLTRAAVALAETGEALPDFLDLGFPGTVFSTQELADEIGRQLTRPIRVDAFPWWALRLSAPFWELGRELLEMRYLYDTPHSIDGEDFMSLFPEFKLKTTERIAYEHLFMKGLRVG